MRAPARELPDIVARLARSHAADAAVSAYADSDLDANFAPLSYIQTGNSAC